MAAFKQLVVQIVIALVAVVFTAIMTAIIAFIVKPLGWRVDQGGRGHWYR